MNILFDQGTPVPLRHFLQSHTVATTFELGWSSLSNGELLMRAEPLFDLLITTDQQLRYQQSLRGRKLAVPGTYDDKLAQTQKKNSRNL